MIGGGGEKVTLRLVARHADGWNTVWAWTPEAYGDRARALDRACEREGRDPSAVRRSVGLYTLIGEDQGDLAARYRALQSWTPGDGLGGQSLAEWGRDKLVGTPEQVLDRLAAFAEHGVEEVICSLASLPFALYDDSALDLLAETVVPAARKLEPPR
jgi:alkanesulfonate monooxygenase SsuD/methylene tetrahydromethanopterin reductase-like flavin-dependent oxidoreductase (luciferase family)